MGNGDESVCGCEGRVQKLISSNFQVHIFRKWKIKFGIFEENLWKGRGEGAERRERSREEEIKRIWEVGVKDMKW